MYIWCGGYALVCKEIILSSLTSTYKSTLLLCLLCVCTYLACWFRCYFGLKSSWLDLTGPRSSLEFLFNQQTFQFQKQLEISFDDDDDAMEQKKDL